MVTRTATLRLQLIDAASGTSRKLAGELRGLEGALSRLGKSGTPEAKRLANQLDQLSKKSKAIGEFREARRGLKDMSLEMKSARSNVDRLKTALSSATKPTAKMASDLKTARAHLKLTSAAFLEQGRAVRASERALQAYGVNSRQGISRAQQEIRNQLAQTIRKMREMDREARKPLPKPPAQPRAPGGSTRGGGGSMVKDAAAGAAGGYVAGKGYQGASTALLSGISFDQAYRNRDAVGDFKASDSAALNAQAERIGQATEFTNMDVVDAQTAVLQKGIRDANTIQGLVEEITHYSRALSVSMEQGAASVVGMALTKGVDVTDRVAVRKMVDRLAWMSKNSGLQDEDLRQFSKFGGPAARVAGLPDDYLGAAGMVFKRQNLGGDEAGVAMRAIMAKLVAPTMKGRLALQAMGLNHGDYVTSPNSFSLPGFDSALKENFGVKLTKELRETLAEVWDSEFTDAESGESLPVKADRGEFTSRTMDALGPALGDMNANDRKKVAGLVGRFHNMSAEAVDATRLLEDFLRKDVSLIRTNAMFTERQGARAAILAQNVDQFFKDIETIRGTKDGVAEKIGVEKMSGIYGDWERMKGTIETAFIRVGQDFEGITRPLINAVDGTVDSFLNLSTESRRAAAAVAALVFALGGAIALRSGAGILGRLLGAGGGAAAGSAGAAAKAGAVGATAGAATKFVKTVKVLGPVGLAAGTGLNVYDAANDPKLTQAEKSARYTGAAVGAGGAWAGAKAGAALGAWGGPWGAAAGGLVGGVGGYLGGDALGQYIGGALASKDPTREAGNQLAVETTRWHVAAQEGMRAYINALATGGADAEAKAAVIAEEIKAILSVEGNPTVNTASLERALTLARQVAAVVSGNPNIATAPAGDASIKVDGARAKGGPVRKGGVYRVNEEGEELFVPGTDGTIIPHGASMSGGGGSRRGGVPSISVVIQNVHLGKGAVESDAERLAQILEAKLSRSAQTMFGGLKFGDA